MKYIAIVIAVFIALSPSMSFAWSWGGGGASISANACAALGLTTGIAADGTLTCGYAIGTDVPGISGTPTDEQIVCWEQDGTDWKQKACGAKTTDNSTASHALYKDSSGYVADQVLSIDAHAASTTITLYPGICPIIHNTSQGDDVAAGGTLPAVADGKCFMGLVVTAKDDETFRLVAASANTVCLDGTCGKDDVGFATTKVVKGSFFTCIGQGTEWFCETGRGTVNAGDL